MSEEYTDICPKCRYASCSPTVWPCRVCVRIHQYKDYFVPDEDEEEQKGEAK